MFVSLSAFVAVGCVEEKPVADLDLEAIVGVDAPTLVTVRWSAAEPVSGTVRFGEGDALDRSAPAEPAGTTHTTLLLGLPADTDVRIQVAAERDGAPWATEETTVHTGTFGGDAPLFTSRAGSAGGFSGYLAVPLLGTSSGAGARGAAVVDPGGRLVWYHGLADGEIAFRARVAVDGSGLLYATEALEKDPAWVETLHRVAWDGTDDRTVALDGLHHDFVELPDGDVYFLGSETHEVDGIPILTDTLERLAPDGTRTVLWHAWDDLGALGLAALDPSHYAVDPDATHGNHLAWIADEDAFLVTLLGTMDVALIDRATGALRWVFGGEASDFALDAAELPLGRIHGAALDGNRLAVFRNDRGDSRSDCSEVRFYDLDVAGGGATRVDTLVDDPCTWIFAFGGVDLLPDGGRLVTWSTAGAIEERDADGAFAFGLDGSLGAGFGYVTPTTALYAAD